MPDNHHLATFRTLWTHVPAEHQSDALHGFLEGLDGDDTAEAVHARRVLSKLAAVYA